MATPNFSALLPERTLAQIDELTKIFGGNRTQLVVRAINDLYIAETNNAVPGRMATITIDMEGYELGPVVIWGNQAAELEYGTADILLKYAPEVRNGPPREMWRYPTHPLTFDVPYSLLSARETNLYFQPKNALLNRLQEPQP